MMKSSDHSYSESFATEEDTEGDDTYARRAHHAGSWYTSDADDLDELLSKFLADAEDDDNADDASSGGIVNACISPHAGFSYSGPTAAYSYLALKEALLTNPALRTIVVIHPSHHVYLDGCAVSGASIIETPLGNIRVDGNLRQQLLSTNKFSLMEREVDEEEHSGEMQYPYIAKIINDVNCTNGNEAKRLEIKILPIMVGSIKSNKEEAFGRLLSPYLSDRAIFTVISSDFCHWGRRFNYMPQPSKSDKNKNINEVHEYIEYLDKQGMNLIEMQRPGAFADYLREHSNTICGRHPISVWLHSLRESSSFLTYNVRFIKYAQSEKARSTRDHSVSYASAVARIAAFDG
eukprot:CAMPEP_0183727328 /NCGR_PEP_ID=MMETSP0737-20130205/25413_1 /TAXON_ID=385413 /ORGANISM="Thalassiosira miniscula, Strain CCMP1093" /LENGTH=347 /DNA_ID=CAMNT_0025958929 /DNA_START=46 /DNA_END=1089 /DNA_ORIENTATION=+